MSQEECATKVLQTALERNTKYSCMAEGALVRVYGLLTDSTHKLEEVKQRFSDYGIDVVMIDPHTEYIGFLKSSKPKYIVKGIICEHTSLIDKETGMEIDIQNIGENNEYHLRKVKHRSELVLHTFDTKKNKFYFKSYFDETNGYLDITKTNPQEKKYGWDDIFVVSGCNKTYLELSRIGQSGKISARDKNISKIIQDHIHYKKLVDLHHNPQNYEIPIDFSKSFHDYIKHVSLFQNEQVNAYMKKFKLWNIIISDINQGTFFKACETRRQRLYWFPGLNPGIPLTPKSKDPIHEITFQMHDFGHFCIPDLVPVPDPKIDENLARIVYITYRLMSEAFTLVLADMLFVNCLDEAGHKYETRDQRKIYPIVAEIIKCNPDYQQDLVSFIYKLLKGSYEHCFFGDSSQWASMMENTEPLHQFAEKYDKYFVADFMWTRFNYDSMHKENTSFGRWWERIEHWRMFGDNLKLQTVGEFIRENRLWNTNGRTLLDSIFTSVFHKYIRGLFESDIMEIISPESQLRNAFVRYMMGQTNIMFKECNYETINPEFFLQMVERTFTKFRGNLNLDIVNNIRGHYNDYLDGLQNNNLITIDDCTNYKQCYALFPPMIVDYDHGDGVESVEEFVKGILYTK